MKTATIGGLIALGVLILAIVLCVWAGGKINEKLGEINPNAPTPNESRSEPATTENAPSGGTHLALGNPSKAAQSADNFLLEGEQYALSYNRRKGSANWVAWRLTKADFGDVDRQNDFRPDDRLPSAWETITPFDYAGSGFDRGHLCPSADRSRTVRANSETFLMTNMAPQTNALNSGPWEKLESYSRSLARRNFALYIIAGHYGENDKIKNKVVIPTNFWKIIVVLPNNGDVSNVSRDTRVIAVDMPNIDGIQTKNWRDYKTTVRQLEQKTGFNFFTNLPEDVRGVLKSKYDARNDQ